MHVRISTFRGPKQAWYVAPSALAPRDAAVHVDEAHIFVCVWCLVGQEKVGLESVLVVIHDFRQPPRQAASRLLHNFGDVGGPAQPGLFVVGEVVNFPLRLSIK